MAATALTRDEALGLGLAAVAHIALFAFLALKPPSAERFAVPERVTVTLSDDIGLQSTSPEPQAQAAADAAPEIGEEPQEKPLVIPSPEPVKKIAPVPLPKTAPRVSPTTTSKSAAKVPAVTAPPPTSRRPPAPAGASRIDNDFLKGVQGAQTSGTSRNPPAAVAGPAVLSALSGAISRQVKPKWVAPQGVDVDKLVTILSWSLNRDGSLSGTPRVVRQDGITDANRPQAARHAEQAVRAVQLAAPFDLPPEYYDAWKRVASFRFDRKLSQ